MLRLLQLAAVLGMLLSTLAIGLAFLNVRDDFVHQYVSRGLHQVLLRVEGSGIWFGLAAILYVLAGMARTGVKAAELVKGSPRLSATGGLGSDLPGPTQCVASRG
jgi:hypothetical protein